MTERSAKHATFSLERTHDASPARVFAAWSTAEAKSKWFGSPEGEWVSTPYELDFRVGGRERAGGGPPGGPTYLYEATYHQIIENERLITSYEMHADDVL